MDLYDPVWSKEPAVVSQGYLCFPEIPRPANPPLYPSQGVPATQHPQPDQREMPSDNEIMELNIQQDIPDLIDVPKEVISDFDAWAQSVLDYSW